MPTSPISTYGAGRVDPLRYSDDVIMKAVNLKASTTFPQGTILGEITATPGTYGPYASGNSDGSQNPALILQYACVTDALGNITLGTGAAGQEWSQTSKGAPCYVPNGQVWSCADLVGLDANAVTKLGGVLLEGTVSAGEVRL